MIDRSLYAIESCRCVDQTIEGRNEKKSKMMKEKKDEKENYKLVEDEFHVGWRSPTMALRARTSLRNATLPRSTRLSH